MPDPTVPERWRVGRTLGRTLYVMVGDDPSKADRCVGMVDTRELAERIVVAMNATAPASDVQRALDRLDDLLDRLDAVSDGDLDAVDAWANNIQLDIMRLRHRREGARHA